LLNQYGNEPSRSHLRVNVAIGILVLYAGVVVAATLSPTPLDQGYEGSIERVLSILHRNGIPEWFGYNKLEFSANIAMFVPIGFLITLLLPARVWWLALVISPAFSVAIELTQLVALSSRFATATDVMSNSLGALIGIIMAVILRAAIYARDTKVIEHALWAHGVQGGRDLDVR